MEWILIFLFIAKLENGMRDNFAPATNYIVTNFEGEYANNPHDPGGATMEGVTQATYDAYRTSHGMPRRSVRSMDIPERNEIYKFEFWDIIRGDNLVTGMDLSVYDCSIHSGTKRAIKILQQALRVPQTGKIDLVTINALQGVNDVGTLIINYNKKRLSFIHRLTGDMYFDKDWTRRVNTVSNKSVILNMKGTW